MAVTALSIGFIGLGAMGNPMAERLAAGGHRLAVFDVDAARMAPFAPGARLCRTAAELADCSDVVFLCLPTLQSHWDVLNGEGGLLQGAQMKACVVTGTIGPTLVCELEAALRPHDVAVVDAPMTGGRLRAADGTLTVMVSGPDAWADAVEPAIACYSNNVIRFGSDVGRAQTMKLINNIMSATNLTIAVEALVFGAKAGLDPEQMLKVINTGTGRNELTHTVVPHSILTRDFNFGSSIATVMKDMSQAIKEAEKLGVQVEITRLIHRLFEDAGRRTDPDIDQTHIVRVLEDIAGTQIPKTR